ncbi:helix-turn-helix domain-containing protein [Galbitalea sp. SE-J8]|uniref:MarR family winged helix-turn-helix transcriptional regulator n=1 Tax=Galbitalea sp. SE-J8 TaxID=3054952 RepID=UPI00259CC2B6|nr:helix-turn-helix domain-containing protein [Galbitalea sp. SE-J8]MDM4762772.1 helix-turn-helix domain-containing protein [Galbitalea sp. SE-J8]
MTETVAPESASRTALEQEVGQQIAALHNAAKHAITRMSHRVHPELQPVGFGLLRVVLGQDAGTRAADLCAQLGIDKGAISRQVTQLKELGLVETAPDPADGRASLITATPAARAAVDAARADIRLDYARVFEGWDERELADFARLLERFVEASLSVDLAR